MRAGFGVCLVAGRSAERSEMIVRNCAVAHRVSERLDSNVSIGCVADFGRDRAAGIEKVRQLNQQTGKLFSVPPSECDKQIFSAKGEPSFQALQPIAR